MIVSSEIINIEASRETESISEAKIFGLEGTETVLVSGIAFAENEKVEEINEHIAKIDNSIGSINDALADIEEGHGDLWNETRNLWTEINGFKDGESAYEIAVRNGFSGTEQEWLESLKGKAELSGYGFHQETGDLSWVDDLSPIKNISFDFENIRCRVSRSNATEIGIIFQTINNLNIPLRITSQQFGDAFDRTNQRDIVVTPTGVPIESIGTSIVQINAEVEAEGLRWRVVGTRNANFSECRIFIERWDLNAGEIVMPEAEPYLQRWEDDLSTVGSSLEIPVDDVVFTVGYRGSETLNMRVRPLVSGAKIAFNRSSIYHGTPEATWRDWSELVGEIDVDDTIYNDARDRCSVRFMTEKGSYKLDLVSFDKGRKVEALLYNFSEIPAEG